MDSRLPDRVPEGVRSESGGGVGCLLLTILIVLGGAAYFFREGIAAFLAEQEIAPGIVALALALALVVIISLLILRARRRRRAETPTKVESMTSPSARGDGCAGKPFFAIFFLAGLLFLIPVGIVAWNLISSMSWVDTECTILSSNVGSHSSSDGTTYSVDITYSYEWEGESYRSSRYNFSIGSSSGYDGKARIVESYPEGSTAVCWVDPEDPSRAVLSRSFEWWLLIFLLFPIAFIGVGLAGLTGRFQSAAGGEEKSDWLPGTDAEESAVAGAPSAYAAEAASPELRELQERLQALGQDASDSLELKPSTTPGSRAVGASCLAIFWNGVVGTIAFFVFRESSPDGCAMLFFGVFALIGIGLLLAIPYNILAMRNPVPTINLSDNFAPGRTIRVSWKFDGDASRIRHLVISIKGIESATYRRGTNTYTSTETFFEQDLVSTSGSGSLGRGETEITLPETVMHSFDGGNNQIRWSLSIKGDIPRWPDVNEEFVVTVRPDLLA